MKGVVAVVASILWFRNPVNVASMMGYGITVSGVVAYSQVRWRLTTTDSNRLLSPCWGHRARRLHREWKIRAAYQFCLHTLFGCVLMLSAILLTSTPNRNDNNRPVMVGSSTSRPGLERQEDSGMFGAAA